MRKSCCGRCGAMQRATTLWRGGMRAFGLGEAAQGESMQRQALEIVRGLGGFPVVQARIHNNLGVILSCTGRGPEARQEFFQALTLLAGRVDPQTRFHQVIVGNFRRAREVHAAPSGQEARTGRPAPARPAAIALPAEHRSPSCRS